MENKELIYRELLKYHLNQLDESERIGVETQLKSSKDYQDIYQEIKELNNVIDDSIFYDSINKTEAWKKINTKINQTSNRRFNFIRMAAVIVPFLFIGSILFYVLKDNNVKIYAKEEIKEVNLPDGTKITLNKKGVLSYNSSEFEKGTRKVSLKGEGYFDVEKGEKPFIVETKKSITKVLGTKFYVKEDSINESLILVEGKVSYSNKTDAIILGKNMKAILTSKSIVVDTSFSLNEIAWKTKVLSFKSTPILQALKAIEGAFNVKVIYNGSVINKSSNVTGEFVAFEEIEDVLLPLSKIANFSYSIKGDIVLIE